ncbi:MAG: hypothetical protein KDK59_00555 [Simkania sp.]|nr:hypothetical protein [Simkania sp.]
MSTNPEPTPLSQPFPGALPVMKRELDEILRNFFYRLGNEGYSKSTMSHLLRLYETMILSRSKEIGGKLYELTQQLIQFCADFANGHGKLDRVNTQLELVKEVLRS